MLVFPLTSLTAVLILHFPCHSQPSVSPMHSTLTVLQRESCLCPQANPANTGRLILLMFLLPNQYPAPAPSGPKWPPCPQMWPACSYLSASVRPSPLLLALSLLLGGAAPSPAFQVWHRWQFLCRHYTGWPLLWSSPALLVCSPALALLTGDKNRCLPHAHTQIIPEIITRSNGSQRIRVTWEINRKQVQAR